MNRKLTWTPLLSRTPSDEEIDTLVAELERDRVGEPREIEPDTPIREQLLHFLKTSENLVFGKVEPNPQGRLFA